MTDLDTHEPMEVRRIVAGGSRKVDPPLDQSWDKLTQLRWHAGVVATDTGVICRITTNCYSEPAIFGLVGPQRFRSDIYGVSIGNATLVGMDFDHTWDYLNGVSDGAEAVAGKR